MTSDKTLKHLFLSGHVEGVSYLLLLFVAMPLKYFADMPKAVSYAGMIHGVLFVWLIFAIFLAFSQDKINLKKAVLVFLASLIPFATFFLERIVLGRKAL
jgi:integral membrane protein